MTSLVSGGWDPPNAFPPGTRRRRTSRKGIKRAFVELPREWRLWADDPAGSSAAAAAAASSSHEVEKRPRKFRNLNTGRVFQKEIPTTKGSDAELPTANRTPRVKKGPRQHYTAQDSGLDLSSPSEGWMGPTRRAAEGNDAFAPPRGPHRSVGPGISFRTPRVLDSAALQWCDGRFMNKEPDYGLLDRLLMIPQPQQNLDPAKMFNRSSGPGSYKDKSNLSSRRPGKKRGCMSKGIYVAKRYKKERPDQSSKQRIMGDPTTLNYLSIGDLMRLVSALKASMGVPKRDLGEAPILLKVLKDSRFDAEEAQEAGLHEVLSQFAAAQDCEAVTGRARELKESIEEALAAG